MAVTTPRPRRERPASASGCGAAAAVTDPVGALALARLAYVYDAPRRSL